MNREQNSVETDIHNAMRKKTAIQKLERAIDNALKAGHDSVGVRIPVKRGRLGDVRLTVETYHK